MKYLSIILSSIIISISKGCIEYTVQSGDNVWAIVTNNCKNSYQCNQENYVIDEDNNMCPNNIYPDQKLKLCCQEYINNPTPTPTPSGPNNNIKYIVKSGDNSWSIIKNICNSDSCNTNNYVLKSNGNICPNDLYVGEEVDVYCQYTVTPTPTMNEEDNGKGKTLYFTIDDGPSASRNGILDVLKEINVKVSFFDSGYNLCNDHPICHTYNYKNNIIAFQRTIMEGHFMGSHSDNHYYNSNTGLCDYINVKPNPRNVSCGYEPVQNMVQGAMLLQNAIFKVKWTNQIMKDNALYSIWKNARLPCSNIWRLPKYNINRVYEEPNETALRIKVADEMFSGNMKCRKSKSPWNIYGFDANVEWYANMNDENEIYNLIKNGFKNSIIKNKVVLLTHDYIFNTDEKLKLLKNVLLRLKNNGYTIDTLNSL